MTGLVPDPEHRRPRRPPLIRASRLMLAGAIVMLIQATGLPAAPPESRQASTGPPHGPPAHPLVVASITIDPNPDDSTVQVAWTAPHRDPADAPHPTITGYRVAIDQHTACRIDADGPLCCVIDGVAVEPAIKVAVVTDSGVGPWVSEASANAPVSTAAASTPPLPLRPAHPVPATEPLAVLALFIALLAVAWCRKTKPLGLQDTKPITTRHVNKT